MDISSGSGGGSMDCNVIDVWSSLGWHLRLDWLPT